MRVRLVFVVVAIMGIAGLAAQEAVKPNDGAEKKQRTQYRLLPAANAFLSSLTDEQRELATFDFDSVKRVQWHFIPKETRKGMPLMDMNEKQQEAAFRLLRSAVSKLGYEKATKIMQLESVLLKLEGPQSAGRRNPEKYYFSIFGKPANKERWGISIEGHHLSLNFVVRGNQVIDSTPQFFATNPATLMDDYGKGFPKGLRVLRAEEQLGFKLVKSFNKAQLSQAMLPGDTPNEIRGAGEPQPPTDAARGVSLGELNEEQLEIAKKLMTAYTQKMKQSVAKQRWKLIEEADLKQVKFAWSGATRPGVGHYYVIQGATFVIEFINVQPDAAGNPANHVHCVWRDMQGDFDLDIAAK